MDGGARGRKYLLRPPEISSLVFLVIIKDEGCRLSPRFHVFVSDVNHRKKRRFVFKIFLRCPKNEKTLLRFPTSCQK